ncbi:DUF2784 domain-containing protein [Azoarcus olearius]|uniref:Threonine efflux protein n=1 Tax=Azoarcus sp. (strain BH72) TaxID=418699 RepID=A1K1N6_AZOSB|nr:DUF2784 domain-containing protein [Azoarcus olearius]CAL92741.1 putative threonine efflux protein [Azoarcus olearius]
MESAAVFRLLANAVLVLHAGFVLFVVAGLVLILVGGALDWRWVRDVRLRVLHLAAIGVVVAESWLGVVCPLTTLELWLRRLGGQTFYEGDFVAFWLRRLLFFDAPGWVFVLAYTGFAALVLLAWWRYPPRRPRQPAQDDGN